MHRILKAHLGTFAKEHSTDGFTLAKQFERFVAYCALAFHYVGRVNFENIATDDDECGIDSVAFVVDEELVTTMDELYVLFSGSRRNREIEIILTQATISEHFQRQKIVSFADAVVDFFREEPRLPQGEVLQNAREIFSEILKNLNKVKDGRPTCSLFFASAGKWAGKHELQGSLDSAKLHLEQTARSALCDRPIHFM